MRNGMAETDSAYINKTRIQEADSTKEDKTRNWATNDEFKSPNGQVHVDVCN